MKAPVYEPGSKTHRDENFPVASRLIASRHRAIILSFYRFARGADDVADHPSLPENEKIRVLDQFEDTVLGRTDVIADALPLRAALDARGLPATHATDLLIAFRMDASRHRYDDWNALMEYCAYSAMPVGRFVLEVHGESRGTWQRSDALCAALQIINHLQDCGADYRRLDRVYIPLDCLARHGASVAALGAPRATPELRAAITDVARRTGKLLNEAGLAPVVRDVRLGLEVEAIERLARTLLGLLLRRDPLSERVHLGKARFAATLAGAVAGGLVRRFLMPGSNARLARSDGRSR